MGDRKVMDEHTWHDVVKECEQILGCDDTAKSPLQSNLPNLIRSLQIGSRNLICMGCKKLPEQCDCLLRFTRRTK